MTILELYAKYEIMPSLQIHMLRVAAVASIICDNFDGLIDKENIVRTELIHDMGNIIKFKLGFIPEAVQPEGLDYWLKIQTKFKNKYGNDEHEAAYQIAQELHVNERVLDLLNSTGFSHTVELTDVNDYAKKICCYSDHRVTPDNITSLQVRMLNGKQRFEANKKIDTNADALAKHTHDFEIYAAHMELLERQIFEKCRIKPEYITNETVAPVIEVLKTYTFN
jgi:hypothetical protein